MTGAEAAAWLAHGLGLGHVPLAPGTAGALGGALLALGLARLRRGTRMLVAAALVGVALPICEYGGHNGPEDDPRIVADELLTFPVATAALPLRGHPGRLAGVFVASRALDALKPPPARGAERLGGGLGVVLDDLVSNLYTLALVTWYGYRAWRRYRDAHAA